MKGFLTSILGTTISIVLTFGTTALINAQKKKAAQKQTAMMVIHDINTTIESLEYSRDEFDKNYQSAQYFLENMDRPEEADPEKLSEAIDASLKLLIHSDQEARNYVV